VVHEPEHRRCTCAVRELVHHRDELVVREPVTRHFGSDMTLRHHDGRDLVLHLYIYVVRESVLSHHDGRVVHALELRRCTYAVRVLALRLYGNDLLVHHRDGLVARGLVLRRCTCEVRELDVHLHSGHVIHLAFRHPCAVVFRKDSKHHYCALLHVLRRAVIQRGCEHLDREVRVVHGIRLLPP
jgi:hypothetical protein